MEASIPFGNHPELRRMLLVGHGTLCLVDGVDVAIRSKMEILDFALHLNFVAWRRFVQKTKPSNLEKFRFEGFISWFIFI